MVRKKGKNLLYSQQVRRIRIYPSTRVGKLLHCCKPKLSKQDAKPLVEVLKF